MQLDSSIDLNDTASVRAERDRLQATVNALSTILEGLEQLHGCSTDDPARVVHNARSGSFTGTKNRRTRAEVESIKESTLRLYEATGMARSEVFDEMVRRGFAADDRRDRELVYRTIRERDESNRASSDALSAGIDPSDEDPT